MEILEYFAAENKAHWLAQIARADWGAGQYLARLLGEDRLRDAVGSTALVLMLTDKERLVSFCTFAPLDDIQPTDLSPWVGFAYTFPAYRGNRCLGRLLDCAECLATVTGREAIYISTSHTGLYEKYGYVFYRMDKDISGEDTRVYRKRLTGDDPDADRRMAMGVRDQAALASP